MFFFIILVFVALLVLGNYMLERSVLYPPFLFSSVWLLVLTVYSMQIIEVDELHTTVLFVVGCGAFLFSLGGLIGRLIPKSLIQTKITLLPKFSSRTNLWFQYLLIIFTVVGMLLVLKSTLAAGAGGEGATFLARARNGTGQGGADTPAVVLYFPELIIFTAVLISMERRDWVFWTVAVIAFATAVFTTSRGPILQLLCGIVSVSMIRQGKLRFAAALRYVRIPALFFLALFVSLIFATKSVSVEGGVATIVISGLITYLVGPTAALDKVLENPSLYLDQPNHTLKLPLQLLAKAHLISFTPASLLDEWVLVPFPANVYTGYKFFYTDYGFAGVFGLIFIIGFAHTLLYRKAVSGSQLALYWFGMSTVPLVMFFFDDGYSALGVQLTTFMFGCLYFMMRSVSLGPANGPGRMLTRQTFGPQT